MDRALHSPCLPRQTFEIYRAGMFVYFPVACRIMFGWIGHECAGFETGTRMNNHHHLTCVHVLLHLGLAVGPAPRLVRSIVVVSCSGDLGSLPAVVPNMISGVMMVPI